MELCLSGSTLFCLMVLWDLFCNPSVRYVGDAVRGDNGMVDHTALSFLVSLSSLSLFH